MFGDRRLIDWPVEDEAERALVVVPAEEDDGAGKVGVDQLGAGDEQFAGERFGHGSIIAESRPIGEWSGP